MTKSSEQKTSTEYTLKQRLQAGLALFLLMGFLVFLAWQFADAALDYPHAWIWLRGTAFSLAALMMALPIYMIMVMLRRKWKTGRFTLPRAEAVARQAAIWNSMGAGKPLWPQLKVWSVTIILLLICCVGAVVCIVVAFRLCSCPDSRGLRNLFLALAGLCLILPAWTLFSAIRRKRKTGYYLPSQEEIAERRAKCGMPKPLWQRILPAIMWSFNAVLFTWSAISHNHIGHTPPHDRWILAAAGWFLAILCGWQVFRPSACAILPPTDADRPPSIMPQS